MKLLASTAAALALLAPAAEAAPGPGESGGRQEVRAEGVCGPGVSSRVRLRSDGGAIRLELRVRYARGAAAWRVAVVHERRVAWKASRSTRGSGALELERTLPDLPGADAVTVLAWGPRGLTCSVTATLPA